MRWLWKQWERNCLMISWLIEKNSRLSQRWKDFPFFTICIYAVFRQSKEFMKMQSKEKKRWTQKKNIRLATTNFSAASTHSLIIFTIFLSFNAAVKKVTQLLPVYRQNARFFYIKRFNFFFVLLPVVFFSSFSSSHRQKMFCEFMCLHFASWAVQGTRGVERGEGWTCFLQIKINCWDFHAEWKVSERALCPFITTSTSSHCPINLFSLFFCWAASVFVIFISFILNSAFCIVKSCMRMELSVCIQRKATKAFKELTTRPFEFAHNSTT